MKNGCWSTKVRKYSVRTGGLCELKIKEQNVSKKVFSILLNTWFIHTEGESVDGDFLKKDREEDRVKSKFIRDLIFDI